MFTDKTLQDATTSGNGSEIDLNGCERATFYYKGNGTTSGGAFQLETASVPGYTGTWAPLAASINMSTITGNVELFTQVLGPLRLVRARITSTVTGGGSLTCGVIAQ